MQSIFIYTSQFNLRQVCCDKLGGLGDTDDSLMIHASLVPSSYMEASAQRSGFKPYVGEGFISPYRQLVTDIVKDLVTEKPSFARAIQKRCLGPAGRLALPVIFMSKYLIGSQGQIILEDQDGVPWKIGWIAYMQSGRRLAFTHGWPAFVSHCKIKDGDIFIAEIVASEHWKAHVISAEGGYTRQSSFQLGHNAEEILHENKEESHTDVEKHCNGMNKMDDIRTSPLSFLKAENKITRRKRSGKRKSREGSRPFAESSSKASRETCISTHKEELLGSDSDEGSMPSLNDSVQQVSALVKSDEISAHVVEKKQVNENFLYHSKGTLVQSCFLDRDDADFINADIGKSFNKNKAYEACYCQSTKEHCHQYVLHGFQHCILHILEDASAPYKQCDFMDGQTYSRCGFPVCLDIVDTRFCQIHKQHDVIALDACNPGKALWNILPKLGDLSLMMMAAMVAHQSHKEADFWFSRKFQVLHDSCETKENFKSDIPVEGKKFCREKFKSPKPLCGLEQNVSVVDVQLLPAKVNEENIVRYLGWKFHAANKVHSEMRGHVVEKSENDSSSVDGVKERTDGLSDGQNPIPCSSLFGNSNNIGQDTCKRVVTSENEKESIIGASSDSAFDKTSFSNQERTLCAMHVQGKRISFSRFVGIRKRPWDVSDCGIPDGIQSHDVASTVAISGKKECEPVGNRVMDAHNVKQETNEMSEDQNKWTIPFGHRISSDKHGGDGYICGNVSLVAKDHPISSTHEIIRLTEADGCAAMDNGLLVPESNDSSRCSLRIREEMNSTSSMGTDLTLASTCYKEEHHSCFQQNRITLGPLKFETVYESTKRKHKVNHADSISLAPEGTNVQCATKTQVFVPGVQKYEGQSDDSIDSLPEEPRVTTRLYKRFLDLNDCEQDFFEGSGVLEELK